jgi:hypothetical protein
VKNKTTTIDNGFALIKQSVLKGKNSICLVKDMANGLASESTYLQLKNISD